ncbi:MAG: hypothetical protein JEZ08_08275 [Clostridiales bacterium]|nr:hypothetical protein [Clostridiales bacterium]
MNIVREGPKHLIIQSGNCKISVERMKEIFSFQMHLNKSSQMYNEYINMIGLLNDASTVLMFTKKIEPKLSFEYEDFEYIVVINEYSEELLIKLFQNKEALKIENIRATPRMIVMRTTGDHEKYIQTVNKDIVGEMISAKGMFEGYGIGTMILFTEKRISGPLGIDDMNHHAIYSKQQYKELSKFLNNHRVKYINASIDNKDWAELVIKIYDSYERYDLHYKRLAMILNELDCGLILGESWGRDAALAFLSVGVYQVRLFTYLEPLEIKKIALGLEYNSHGDRIVDYDLFTKRKKYSWTQVRIDGIKGRDDLGNYYRSKLVTELNEDTIFELMSLECQLK